MARIVLGLVAVIASFMLADSLICNRCSFNLLGTCIGVTNETCTNTTTSCFTSRATFKSLPDFVGFNSQGCLTVASCPVNTSSTVLGSTYTANTTCCSTDKCNPLTLTSDAPATKLTFTAAVGAALLASVWGSVQ